MLGILASIAIIAAGLANAIDSQVGVASVLNSIGRDRLISHKIFVYLYLNSKVPVYTYFILAVVAVIGADQSLDIILTMINFGTLYLKCLIHLSKIDPWFN